MAVDVFWMNVNKQFLNIEDLKPGSKSGVGTHIGHLFRVVMKATLC